MLILARLTQPAVVAGSPCSDTHAFTRRRSPFWAADASCHTLRQSVAKDCPARGWHSNAPCRHPVAQFKNRSERAAANHCIQGSAADIVMMAMMGLSRQPELQQLGYKVILQIHDEFILEVRGKQHSTGGLADGLLYCNAGPR